MVTLNFNIVSLTMIINQQYDSVSPSKPWLPSMERVIQPEKCGSEVANEDGNVRGALVSGHKIS
jgi:hypothetical protein